MSIFGNDFNNLFEAELKKVEAAGVETPFYLAEDSTKKVLCIEKSGNLFDVDGELFSNNDNNRYRYMIENSMLVPKSVLE